MSQEETISEFEFRGKKIRIYSVKHDNCEVFRIQNGDILTQESTDPHMPIRWLSTILINEEFMRTRKLS